MYTNNFEFVNGSLNVISLMSFYPRCPVTFGGNLINKLLLLLLF